MNSAVKMVFYRKCKSSSISVKENFAAIFTGAFGTNLASFQCDYGLSAIARWYPQGIKSTIYMAWLRLFRSHFAVYYRGPTFVLFYSSFRRRSPSWPLRSYRILTLWLLSRLRLPLRLLFHQHQRNQLRQPSAESLKHRKRRQFNRKRFVVGLQLFPLFCLLFLLRRFFLLASFFLLSVVCFILHHVFFSFSLVSSRLSPISVPFPVYSIVACQFARQFYSYLYLVVCSV